MITVKRHRVWFEDGTSCLVDAKSKTDAKNKALGLGLYQGRLPAVVTKIECLD